MENLPNELREEILFNLPPSDVINACRTEQFGSACDWSFWSLKAQKDFGVSSAYFNFLSEFPEGSITFYEIPVVRDDQETGQTQLLFPNRYMAPQLGEGALRYLQIANRFNVLPETLMQTQPNEIRGFLEFPIFFKKVAEKNQAELANFLIEVSGTKEILPYLNRVLHLDRLFSGEQDMLTSPGTSEKFYYSLLDRVLTQQVIEDSSSEEEWIAISQIIAVQSGDFSSLTDFFSEKAASDEDFPAVRNVLGYLLTTGNPQLFPIISSALNNILPRDPEWGSLFLSYALKGGNMQFVEEVLSYGNFFEDDIFSADYCESAYFSGRIEVVEFVRSQGLDIGPALKVEAILQGYGFHRRPEQFFQLIRSFEILDPRLIQRLCSLGDCDIVAHFLHSSFSSSESKLQTAKVFFLRNISALMGNLDILAWMIRVLKDLNGNDKLRKLGDYFSALETEYRISLRGENPSETLFVRNTFASEMMLQYEAKKLVSGRIVDHTSIYA